MNGYSVQAALFETSSIKWTQACYGHWSTPTAQASAFSASAIRTGPVSDHSGLERVWGNCPIYGLELVFHTRPGATLAGEQRGWEAAMPTWVMMDEMDEEVDKDKMMKYQVNLGERGATGGHVAVSVVPHTDSHTKSHQLPLWLGGSDVSGRV